MRAQVQNRRERYNAVDAASEQSCATKEQYEKCLEEKASKLGYEQLD